jgi:putative ABC transport system permease protein
MMAFSDILRLYYARLQARIVLVQELFAVLGIAVGVALLFASQVASTSLNGSVKRLTEDIVGHMQYQLEARGPQGFEAGLLGEVRDIPDVHATLPVIEQQMNLVGPTGQEAVDLIGTEPRLAHAGGPLLRRFSYSQLASQRALALPEPVARSIGAGPLQPITLRVGANDVTGLVGATLQEADIGALVYSPIAVAPIAYAQQLTGLYDRYTRILVQASPGHERAVRAALQRIADARNLNVEPADYVARLFQVAAAPTNQGTELFSAISALVGFLFAFNAMLVTAHLRRTLVDNLRRWGATRLMSIQVLLLDAFVLGVLGSVLGLALGELLSVVVFHSGSGYLSYAFPVGSLRIVTWRTVALAVGVGMAAACVGVLAPLWNNLRRSTRAGVATAHPGRARRQAAPAAGLICLAATTVILLRDDVSVLAAVAAIVCLVAALLLLSPGLFDLIVDIFDRLQLRLYSASTLLSAAELQAPANRARSLAIAATGAIAVFGSVAIGGASANLQRGLDRMANEANLVTGLWVSPAGAANALATTSFPASATAKLEHLPGVQAVSIYRGGFLDIGDRRAWVMAPPRTSTQPIPPNQLTSGDLPLATARIRSHGWAIVSQAIADERHLRVGQSFTLLSPRPTTFRVAGLSTNGGWPPGAILINASDYARAWGSSEASAYNIALSPGASAAQVRGEVANVLKGGGAGLAVQTASQRAQEWQAASRRGLSQLAQIRALMLIAAVLAMAGAMGSMIWQRRPQLAYIKRQGYKKDILWRSLLCESALLLGSGCSAGAVFGLYGQIVQSNALATVTGFPVVVSLGPLIALSSFALVSAVAIAILALPGYLAVGVKPTMVNTT